jgi:hypothetical protein
MNTTTLRFPSEEKIISYLEKHPQLGKEKRSDLTKLIIKIAAEHFANKEISPKKFDIDILSLLMKSKKEHNLKVPDEELFMLRLKLKDALNACAGALIVNPAKL